MIELYKDLAFAALKNPANPFPETGIVGDIHCLDDEELKVFVGLIVNECAKVVEDSKWNLPRGCTAKDQADLLRKHFGVQE